MFTSRRLKVAIAVAVIAIAGWWPVRAFLVYQYGVSELNVASSLVLQRLGLKPAEPPLPAVAATPVDHAVPTRIELDPAFRPFREVGDRLGPRGLGNAPMRPRGGALLDANGDGRLDLYLAHTGRPVLKATTDLVLRDEYIPATPSTLFLNMGNDANGDPILTAVQDLQQDANARYVREELLIENKYRPRTSVAEDEFGPGRTGTAAIAADFNGDGLMDLYVLNFHHGVPFQTDQLGIRVYPAQSNLGRGARDERDAFVVRTPSFLWTPRSDGLVSKVALDGIVEAEGRNVLYLNRGDADGDGIPEWEDVTDAAAVGGRWASASAATADFDRDGDLDLYVANFLDPDFWGFGARRFAGNRNQLYVNQLVETGELRFVNRAEELRVAGLHEAEGLASSVYFPSEGKFVQISEMVVDGEVVGEQADHSWAAMFVDWNRDHWPDLVVANDITNRLRVYENVAAPGGAGRAFRRLDEFDSPLWDGSWMGMAAGDLDGDGAEELLLSNCGSQVMSARNTALFLESDREANVAALSVLNYANGRGTMDHAVLSYRPGEGFRNLSAEVEVHHSPYIPPDLSKRANFAPRFLDFFEEKRFATSLTGYEFAWNAPLFDVDNDGDLDVYMAGSLARGNDDFVGDWSGSPGRLLVNESSPGKLVFRDRTLEYQLLDITHMDYRSNPPRRPAPGTRWHKRDYIYLTDSDSYGGMGLDASHTAISDLFRMHEAGGAILPGDLNGDGMLDLVVTHASGYDSVSPDARNLKVEFAGRQLAVPAPNKVNKPPTQFEAGPTFVYVNAGPPLGSEGHWAAIRLHDAGSANRLGVGARVVVNGKVVRTHSIGGLAFGATTADLHVGLGAGWVRTLDIEWPSGDPAPQHLELAEPVRDRVICVDRSAGVVPCAERDRVDPELIQARAGQ